MNRHEIVSYVDTNSIVFDEVGQYAIQEVADLEMMESIGGAAWNLICPNQSCQNNTCSIQPQYGEDGD